MDLDKNKKLLIILSMLLAFGTALMGLYSKYFSHQNEGISLLFILVSLIVLLCVCFFVIQYTQLKVKQEVQKNIDSGMNEDEAYKKVIRKRQNKEALITLLIWLIPVSIGSSNRNGTSLIDQSETIQHIWMIWLILGWLPSYAYFRYKKRKNNIIKY